MDSALQVVDEYQTKILKLEQAIMLRPKMSTVRSRTSSLLLLCSELTNLLHSSHHVRRSYPPQTYSSPDQNIGIRFTKIRSRPLRGTHRHVRNGRCNRSSSQGPRRGIHEPESYYLYCVFLPAGNWPNTDLDINRQTCLITWSKF